MQTRGVTTFPIEISLALSELTMNLKELSEAETPQCGDQWRNASSSQRESWVQDVLAGNAERSVQIEITELRDDGQIILRLKQAVLADKRGELLLDFEATLKSRIDPALTVWLEPLGDRSSLRRLRGIEVKS